MGHLIFKHLVGLTKGAAVRSEQWMALTVLILLSSCGGVEKGGDAARLLGQLSHAEAERRAWAAEEIGRMGRGACSAIPALAAGLADSSPGVRSACAKALGRVAESTRRARPELDRALCDQDWTVREAAAWAIGRIGATQAGPMLVSLMSDDDVKVRRTVADTLGRIPSLRCGAESALVSALTDESISVRSTAIASLGKRDVLQETSIAALVQAARHPDSVVRWTAIGVLGTIQARGESEVKSTLLAALEDGDEFVRSGAVDAIDVSRLFNQGDVIMLLELRLGDSSPSVRLRAASALVSRNACFSAAVRALAQLVEDDDYWDEAMRALESLGVRAAGAAGPVLLVQLGSAAHEVRSRAARVLGALEVVEAPAKLRAMLTDEALSVRVSAAIGLAKLEEWSDEVVEALCEGAATGLPHLRIEAIDAIGEMVVRKRGAIETLRRLREDPDYLIRKASERALQQLED